LLYVILLVALCIFVVALCIFVLFYVFLCSLYCLFCDVSCVVCVYICTEQLPPGGYPIAVKYISYHSSKQVLTFLRDKQPLLMVYPNHDGNSVPRNSDNPLPNYAMS